MSRTRCAVLVVTSLLVATLLTFPLSRFVVYSRAMFLVAAVVLAARYAGLAAGVVVSLASVIIFDWFFGKTPGVLDFSVGNVVRAVVFCSLSVLVASLEKHRRYVMEQLETSNENLRIALDEVKTLRGLLPICMYCKQIRTDGNKWVAIEDYVRSHSEAQFSHGLCPACYQEHYPEIYKQSSVHKAS